jgi:hypothetical protein
MPFLDSLRQDVRYSFRTFRKALRFAAVALLSLGLGIGANSAIFSTVNGEMLQLLPVDHPESLVLFENTSSEGTSVEDGNPRPGPWPRFSFANYRHFADNVSALALLAAFRSGEVRLSVVGERVGESAAPN